MFFPIFLTAPPWTPFPSIDKCDQRSEGSKRDCIVLIHHQTPINLTCYAQHYYPNISITFRKGSKEIEPINEIEWDNQDGTKNKLISIKAPVSTEPYICDVAQVLGAPDCSARIHFMASNISKATNHNRTDSGPSQCGSIRTSLALGELKESFLGIVKIKLKNLI